MTNSGDSEYKTDWCLGFTFRDDEIGIKLERYCIYVQEVEATSPGVGIKV